MNVLFDTCIIIDALQDQGDFSEPAQQLFRLVASERINGFITAKSITDIHYLMHSYFHDKAKTLSVLLRLMSLFRIIDTSASDVLLALNSAMSDYEDAVMAESAKRCLLDAVVTRDGHFRKADIRIVSPSSLISELADKALK